MKITLTTKEYLAPEAKTIELIARQVLCKSTGPMIIDDEDDLDYEEPEHPYYPYGL